MSHFGIATKAIILNPGNQILVIYKSSVDEVNPHDYDLPGGRLDFAEKVEDGLLREIREEVGIVVAIGKPSRVWSFVKEDLHLVGITFLAQYLGGEIVLSDEHTSYLWQTKEEILHGNYPAWLKEEVKMI